MFFSDQMKRDGGSNAVESVIWQDVVPKLS